MPVAVCANLPYYITSPIVMKLLGDRLPIESLTVMVQKEAADRICRPGHLGLQCHQLCGELPCLKSKMIPNAALAALPGPWQTSAVVRWTSAPPPRRGGGR